ncbi:MAG: metallophosphoesterase [Sedimentisphaerales bacterium]|nr:metallophosphoesterase [Sedimentisphaerales bacterium]
MSESTIDLLQRGQKACSEDSCRQGNLISLGDKGRLIATGDIHGHRRNFERIVSYADLDNNPDTHVVIHEIIHGGNEDEEGGCLSYRLLFDVIKYKLKYPDRVHMLLGNHDTTFINNTKVMKGGREMNKALRDALGREFGDQTEEVKLAIRQFLFSQALAIKCANGIWFSHSLPADRYADDFDITVFKRELKINDVVKPGAAYVLTWGRRMSQKGLDKLAQKLNADVFIVGHQAQSKGYCRAGDNLIILASDHNHGCIIPIDLSRPYTTDELMASIIPIASIA